MIQYPEAVEAVMNDLKQLPGIGRRGAERLILALLDWDREELISFGTHIANLPQKISRCPQCGGWSENGGNCRICSDLQRDRSTLCVVETMAQLFAVENGGSYRGLYLVLGGKLSPLNGENGEKLNFDLLKKRAGEGEIKEVILALSSDVEGRATALYLSELLSVFPVAVSQPALGLPAGANLSFADGATIAAAFTGRKKITN